MNSETTLGVEGCREAERRNPGFQESEVKAKQPEN